LEEPVNPTRFLTVIGLALGAIWALTSFGEALLAAAVALVGFLIGLILEGRINIDFDSAFGRGSRTR
jgi:hypothetical protein